MNRTFSRFCFTVVLLSNTAAFGQFDDFESYVPGNIDGQGDWLDFGGLMANEISTDVAFSGSQSLKQTIGPVAGNPVVPGYGSDLFMDLPVKMESGEWMLNYQMYVPSSFDGAAVMLASEGFIAEADFDSGMFLVADGTTGFNEFFLSVDGGNPESTTSTLVRDQWTQVEAHINLDANTVDVSYDGISFYSGPWDPTNAESTTDNNVQAIGGLNLWVQGGNGGSVYYDDISLSAVPEPGNTLMLFALLGLQICLRQKRDPQAPALMHEF